MRFHEVLLQDTLSDDTIIINRRYSLQRGRVKESPLSGITSTAKETLHTTQHSEPRFTSQAGIAQVVKCADKIPEDFGSIPACADIFQSNALYRAEREVGDSSHEFQLDGALMAFTIS